MEVGPSSPAGTDVALGEIGSAEAASGEAGLATPVCGEMVMDITKANGDTAIGHECGEWRPMIKTGGGGGGGKNEVTDNSWHHPPNEGSGSGSGMIGGSPVAAPMPAIPEGDDCGGRSKGCSIGQGAVDLI